ncbi:hypothetical protein BAMA_24695 [Bacillus manliponensis]|uniref:Uncharacterized protein n=1 Tax=Bacillus manliponensis TaxID=574376 RepID=A0A073JY17_9BACI|nr:hypothetical protein [Bacillus manliponensis]KEK19196.1 hypothetical protein BAMA_24695 [Bacillus manliponensis]
MVITLRNYSKLGSYIVINNSTYFITETKEGDTIVQGVGGFSENGQLVGVYVEDNTLFFLYNGQSFKEPIDDLICTNNYVSKLERCFRINIREQDICNIVYEPFIDPGMIHYDADPEEFDVLLYISGLLKGRDSMRNFIKGMEFTKKQNEN